MRHATQNFDFPTCSDENFWIFLRGATRRARLAPNRVKKRDRKIQLSSTASCSSPLIAPPPMDCGRPGAHAVDASERRPRPTSCASSASTPPPPGPAVDRTRPPCRTPPLSSPLLSSPRPATRPPGARSVSRWRGARGDRGAARRRSARASRAGAAARGSGCGGAAREARASQNRTDRSCCSFCSSATRSSATSVATRTPDISRSVHVHSCRSSARLRARAAAAARLGCTAWPPARHRRRPHGLWRRRRSVPPRHMIHSGRVGRPNRRGAARVDLQRPHRPGCSSHRRGGDGRPPRADRPTADLMSAGVVHGPAGCNSAAPEERGLAHRASPEASSPLTSQRRSSTEDMHVIAGPRSLL